jgi:hypothetical protein
MNWQARPHALGSLLLEIPQSVQRPLGAAGPADGAQTAGAAAGEPASGGGIAACGVSSVTGLHLLLTSGAYA